MKKLLCTLCMVGAVAFLVSSCKKNDEKVEITVSLPTFEEAAPEPGEGDRIYIDFASNTFKWNDGDQLMVYNVDALDGTNTKKAVYTINNGGQGQTSMMFTGEDLGARKNHFFAFYPVAKIKNGTADLDVDNFETFVVPATQTYTVIDGQPTVDPTALAAAVEVNSLKEAFTMKHIFGICRLKLKGNRTVSSIVLEDKAMGLSGEVSMKIHKVDMEGFNTLMGLYTIPDNGTEINPQFVTQWNSVRTDLGYNAVASGNTLTLNCPNGVQLSPNTQTPFYFVVRPGAFIKGFTITVNFTEGEPYVFNNYANPKDSYKMRPGYIKGFAPSTVMP